MTIIFTLILSVSVSAAPGSVKGIKKSYKYGTYKGWVSKTKMKKIKYKVGYKISWKKAKNASGYQVYAYMVGSKKWMKVKTTKKNYYVLTNILGKNSLKIKVRAYEKKNNNVEYGKFSKQVKIKTKGRYQKRYKNNKVKVFYDRYAGENAFAYQNKLRKNAGRDELQWSDDIYKIALIRAKQISEDYSHDKLESTVEDYLKKNYGITDAWYEKDVQTEYGEMTEGSMYAGAENIALGQHNCKEVMSAWKESKGHYANFISENHHYGAVACYFNGDTMFWVALFSEVDIDTMKNNK